MKTVMDAVNEFKGEWPFNDLVAYYSAGANGYGFYGSGLNEDAEVDFICDTEEFNDLVSQLETNFGVCELTYAKYKRAVTKSTKELQVMDEESNQCKISNLGNLLHNMSCSMDDEDEQNEFGGYASFCWYLADELRKSECAVDTTKPVFTQAMADNGELPQVGASVQFVGDDDYLVEFSVADGDELECICHTKDFEDDSIGVYRHNDGYSVSILTQLIKPIDTRADKEKAIDEMMERQKESISVRHLLSFAYDKWVGE